MSRVQVLYFAGVRELLGIAEEELTLPEEVRDLAAFVRFLQTQHPVLAGRLVGVRFAINETFANDSDALAAGDVVAVIPPVAGG
jgi:molybdopterin converting factor subunit 1